MEIDYLLNHLLNFDLIWELIRNNNIMDIIESVSKYSNIEVNILANIGMGGYSKGKSSGNYYYVLSDLKENLIHYQWLEKKLADDRSKEVYLNLLRFRILPNFDFLKMAYDKDHDQYFDHKIVQCDENEIFVDCGGYIGDTVESFINNYKLFNKIYTYEPSRENINKSKEVIIKYNSIILRPYGVGTTEDHISFIDSGSSSSFMGKDDESSDKINITSLDLDILEPVSFIKMNIEGFEIDALIGAKHHIINEKPKLAICVYHLISDIWEIPRLILAMNCDYKLYLRHYREDQNWETVIYAIPPQKHQSTLRIQSNDNLNVYSINGDAGYWTNQQLTKDCGIIPYLFYKHFG